MIHYLNISKDELLKKHSKLYRYYSFERILEHLYNEILIFINPQLWRDPFEKLYLNAKYKFNEKEYSLPIKDKIYCLCFTGTLTSEAFWHIYTPKGDGVRVTVDTQNLLSQLSTFDFCDIYIGKVEYKKTSDIMNHEKGEYFTDSIISQKINEEQLKILLLKRNTFKYENEIRVMVVPHKGVDVEKDILASSIDIKELFVNYLAHPLIDQYTYWMMKDYLKKEYDIRLKKSNIYAETGLEISLTQRPRGTG